MHNYSQQAINEIAHQIQLAKQALKVAELSLNRLNSHDLHDSMKMAADCYEAIREIQANNSQVFNFVRFPRPLADILA